MTRCTKADDAKGGGCVKEAGHGGRCKVRDDAEKRHRAGEGVPKQSRSRAGSAGRAARGGSLAKALADLTSLGQQIEAEIASLIADANRAVAAVRAVAAKVNTRNRELLRSLVASRRQVRAMADGAEATAGRGDDEEASP